MFDLILDVMNGFWQLGDAHTESAITLFAQALRAWLCSLNISRTRKLPRRALGAARSRAQGRHRRPPCVLIRVQDSRSKACRANFAAEPLADMQPLIPRHRRDAYASMRQTCQDPRRKLFPFYFFFILTPSSGNSSPFSFGAWSLRCEVRAPQ